MRAGYKLSLTSSVAPRKDGNQDTTAKFFYRQNSPQVSVFFSPSVQDESKQELVASLCSGRFDSLLPPTTGSFGEGTKDTVMSG